MPAHNQSNIKSWRRCQKQFAYRYDYAPEGKELVPRSPSLPLKRGSWLHAMQEAHHREWAVQSGFDPAQVYPNGEEKTWEDVHEELTQGFNALFDEEKEDYGDLPGDTRRLFRNYLRFWQDDAAAYDVSALADGSPGIEFVVEVALDKWGLHNPFKGRIDLLVEDGEVGGLWIRDAKWVKTIPPEDDRMMSPQRLMYIWALRGMGYDVRGFVHAYGRTKPPTIPHPVYRGTRLSTAKKIDTDFRTYALAIKKLHGKNWKRWANGPYREKLLELKARDTLWFRRERSPTDPEMLKQAVREFIVSARQAERREKPHLAPRAYDYRCKWDCGYHDLCVAEFAGLDIESMIGKGKPYVYEEERYGDETNAQDYEAT